MAIKFQVRGNSLDAYYAAAWKGHGVMGGSDSNLPIVTTALPGVWDGQMIDMSQKKALTFLAADNWCVGSNEFTLHLRVIPKWSGDATVFQSFMAIFNSNYIQGGALFGMDGGPGYAAIQNGNGGNVFGGDMPGSTIPFLIDEARDIYLVSSATQVKLYSNAHGTDATLLGTASVSVTPTARSRFLATALSIGSFDTRNSDWYLVEANILDTAIDPIALGIRTGYMSVPGNIEKYAQSDPGAASVLTPAAGGPTNYIAAGITQVGTYSPTLPAAGDLREGVVVGSVTGTLAVAPPAAVLYQTPTDNTVGTYVPAIASNVKINVSFGPAGGLTGTYDGSDRWTSPTAAQLLLGVQLKSNSQTNNLTGTLTSISPGTDKVVNGTSFVINSVGFVGTFSSASSPLAPDKVKHEEVYVINGVANVGTYRGYDLWTAIAAVNVSSGIAMLQDGVSGTGSRQVITNETALLTLNADDPAARLDSPVTLAFTQGDAALLKMVANKAAGSPYDLTGATLTSYMLGPDKALVTFDNSKHTIDPDQTTHKGRFSLSLLTADTASVGLGDGKEIVTKAVQGGTVSWFHGYNILSVLSSVPVR